jgi:hypothetical protein
MNMTKMELANRILLAWECPNCIWEFDRRNGYVWKEEGMTFAVPGVAVMCVGLDDVSENRSIRAIQAGLEWSYTLHMEQAISFLFQGNTYGYNECVLHAGERGLLVPYKFFTFKNIEQIWEILNYHPTKRQ